MSEPIPEAIPTSYDPRSQRPTKRQALGSRSHQASQIDALFANPDREVRIPDGSKTRVMAPPPEIVTNVQGSSAGAGSGEFHVYKASRRREQERVRVMEDEVQKEKDTAEFEQRREANRVKEGKRSSKNKARRDKAKDRKAVKEKADASASMKEAQHGSGPSNGVVPNKAEAASDASNGAENLVRGPNLEVGVVIHDDD